MIFLNNVSARDYKHKRLESERERKGADGSGGRRVYTWGWGSGSTGMLLSLSFFSPHARPWSIPALLTSPANGARCCADCHRQAQHGGLYAAG